MRKLCQIPAFFAAAAILLTGCRSLLPLKTVSLPPAVQAHLDKEYSGWALHQVDPAALKNLKKKTQSGSPMIVSGDFNGDGLEDVALLIDHNSRQLLIIAQRLGGSDDYSFLRVYEDGADYLFVLRRGEKGFDYNTRKEFTLPQDSAEVNWMGKAARAYVFKDGKYRMVQTFDARMLRRTPLPQQAPPAPQPARSE